MRLWKRLFSTNAGTSPEDRDLAASCPHVVLIPRWDDANDVGDVERATAFRCEACGSQFDPFEAKLLRATEAERVHAAVGDQGE
jgi:hypothetical protein